MGEKRYGEYFKSIQSRVLNVLGTFFWLAEGDVEAETENEIIAAQGLAKQTKCYATNVFTSGTDIKCRYGNFTNFHRYTL
jgi:hypothetical protein